MDTHKQCPGRSHPKSLLQGHGKRCNKCYIEIAKKVCIIQNVKGDGVSLKIIGPSDLNIIHLGCSDVNDKLNNRVLNLYFERSICYC